MKVTTERVANHHVYRAIECVTTCIIASHDSYLVVHTCMSHFPHGQSGYIMHPSILSHTHISLPLPGVPLTVPPSPTQPSPLDILANRATPPAIPASATATVGANPASSSSSSSVFSLTSLETVAMASSRTLDTSADCSGLRVVESWDSSSSIHSEAWPLSDSRSCVGRFSMLLKRSPARSPTSSAMSWILSPRSWGAACG